MTWVPGAFAWNGARVAEHAGDEIQILLPAGALAASVYLRDWEGAAQHTKAFLLNFGTTTAIKLTVDRQRPYGGGGQSFPSGHTSAAFQGASFIQMRYGWRFGIPAYLAATYVGWNRVEGRPERHYTSDAVAGAALGVLSSYLFTTPYRNVSVQPDVGEDLVGLRLSVGW